MPKIAALISALFGKYSQYRKPEHGMFLKLKKQSNPVKIASAAPQSRSGRSELGNGSLQDN
jgi:hypothetical protein